MYSWSISWISWCLDGASEVCRWNLSFSLRAVLPVSKQQGAVLNEVSISLVTFCPLRMMGLLQSCLKEEGERKRIERGSARQRHGGRVRGGYCIAQQNSVWGGGVTFLPLFYISVVFGQAPLHMCNYHWHCYFFRTQVQASSGWLVCFVSPGHS